MAKIFITGGISSGKSGFAEKTALLLHKTEMSVDGGGRRGLAGKDFTEKSRGLLHFIATARLEPGCEDKNEKNETRERKQCRDEELALKIKKHKEKRNKTFIVHENFGDLYAEIDGIRKFLSSGSDAERGVILIDSMTLWLSSIFKDISGCDSALKSVMEFPRYLSKIECSVVTVADSLGFNMVPVDAYSRKFIEFNGLMEQKLSAVSDEAYFVIAGNPVALK